MAVLVFSNSTLFLGSIFLIKMVDCPFGFADCLLAFGFARLVTGFYFFSLLFTPCPLSCTSPYFNAITTTTRYYLPDWLWFIIVKLLVENGGRGKRRGLWTRCKWRSCTKRRTGSNDGRRQWLRATTPSVQVPSHTVQAHLPNTNIGELILELFYLVISSNLYIRI